MIPEIARRKRSKVQIDRIDAVVGKNWASLTVIWDPNPVENTLRFYLETADHIRVIESSGNLTLDELEKLTDEQLPQLLISLSGGRL